MSVREKNAAHSGSYMGGSYIEGRIRGKVDAQIIAGDSDLPIPERTLVVMRIASVLMLACEVPVCCPDVAKSLATPGQG